MLHRLKSLGFERVFSDNLAGAVGVTASQVRRDFAFFGISGNKRGGYAIDALIEKMRSLLGKGSIQKVIIVGAGHIGQALMHYKGFVKEGIRIVAAFDIDAQKQDQHQRIPVFSMECMQPYAREHDIKLGIICVPEHAAQEVFDQMLDTPIEGVLNFAPMRLIAHRDCEVHNVNVGLELETVVYFVNAKHQGVRYADSAS